MVISKVAQMPASSAAVDSLLQEIGAALQPVDIGLELAPAGIILGDGIQLPDPVDDRRHAGRHQRNESGDGTQEKGGSNGLRENMGEPGNVRNEFHGFRVSSPKFLRIGNSSPVNFAHRFIVLFVKLSSAGSSLAPWYGDQEWLHWGRLPSRSSPA